MYGDAVFDKDNRADVIMISGSGPSLLDLMLMK
jgi:hypothetical protein